MGYSSGTTLGLPILNLASTSMLIMISTAPGVFPFLSTEATDTKVVLEPVVVPHVTATEIFLKQFCTLLKDAVSSLLHDSPAFKVVIAMLEG